MTRGNAEGVEAKCQMTHSRCAKLSREEKHRYSIGLSYIHYSKSISGDGEKQETWTRSYIWQSF
jgi:hypothetical protein